MELIFRNMAKIAGVNVAETFPEIVNVIPLDHKEQNSIFNDISVNARLPDISSIGTGGGGGASTMTGIFQGQQNITIQLPNGETLAKAVKPFMLKGYSGIVS